MKSVNWSANSQVVPYNIHTGEYYQGYLAPIPESMDISDDIYTEEYYGSIRNQDIQDFITIDPLEDLFEEFEELTDVEKDILNRELFGSDDENDSDSDDMD